MQERGHNGHKSFLKDLLDLLNDFTKIPMAIFLSKLDKYVYSKNFPVSFFEKILNKGFFCINRTNDSDQLKNECNKIRKLGIWCNIIPLCTEKNLFGYLLIGFIGITDDDGKCEMQSLLSNLHQNDVKELNLLDKTQFKTTEENGSISTAKIDFIVNFLNLIFSYFEQLSLDEDCTILTKSDAAIFVHNMLLPIQSIVATASILKEGSKDDTELNEWAQNLLEETQKFSYMVENFRDAFFGTESIERLNKNMGEKINLLELLQESILLFKSEALYKGVFIRDPTVAPDIEAIIFAYPHLIKQVFYNIIHNAVKYSFRSSTGENNFIDINLYNNNNKIFIVIQNCGIGILQKEIQEGSIFKPGYRGVLARDRNRNGSGLGLSVAKKIVESLGGGINISSFPLWNETKGIMALYSTSITVSLPIIPVRG